MSILYGSNERDANNLRTFKKGLLKSRDLRGKEYMPQTCKANCHRSSVCYMAGMLSCHLKNFCQGLF